MAFPSGPALPPIGFGLALDLGGGTFGARISGGYLLQLSGDFTRRVGSPLTAIVPRSATADVTVNPGDQVRIGIAPFVRLARAFGVVGSAVWLNQGTDDVRYATAADSVPGVPASLLAEGTGASRFLLSIGVTYSSPGTRADGTGRHADRRRLALGNDGGFVRGHRHELVGDRVLRPDLRADLVGPRFSLSSLRRRSIARRSRLVGRPPS